MALKADGVKGGIPDLFLAIRTAQYGGLWIELKAKKNTLSKKQKERIDRLEYRGYKCVVSYSAKEAIDAIKEYLKY